ncbi:hypothetical protein KKHLCK_10605 [Candidatus Electrothrix laxa]
MFGWPVADIKQRKLFQFIDKPFLRTFGPFGNNGKAASIRAVQGDNFIRFTKINIFQNNASGTAGLVRQNRLFRDRILFNRIAVSYCKPFLYHCQVRRHNGWYYSAFGYVPVGEHISVRPRLGCDWLSCRSNSTN